MKESVDAIAFFGSTLAVSNFASMNDARQRPNIQITGSSIVARISPGEVITINMQGVGPDTQVDAVPEADGTFSTRLAETRVLIGGQPVPVLSAGKGQVTAFVPFGISVLQGRTASVQLEYQGRVTGSGGVQVSAANPAIYTLDGSGSGAARLTNEDGSPNGPDNPARKGSVVTLEATGLGAPDASGAAPKGELEVRIGAATCEIVAAGLSAEKPGIYRIRARVPDAARTGSATSLILTVDGAPSQFDLTVSVQ